MIDREFIGAIKSLEEIVGTSDVGVGRLIRQPFTLEEIVRMSPSGLIKAQNRIGEVIKALKMGDERARAMATGRGMKMDFRVAPALRRSPPWLPPLAQTSPIRLSIEEEIRAVAPGVYFSPMVDSVHVVVTEPKQFLAILKEIQRAADCSVKICLGSGDVSASGSCGGVGLQVSAKDVALSVDFGVATLSLNFEK